MRSQKMFVGFKVSSLGNTYWQCMNAFLDVGREYVYEVFFLLK